MGIFVYRMFAEKQIFNGHCVFWPVHYAVVTRGDVVWHGLQEDTGVPATGITSALILN